MRELNKEQILNICYGATFLGSGGGGPFKTGQNLVGPLSTTHGLLGLSTAVESLIEKSLGDGNTAIVQTVDEVSDTDGLTAMVAFMGSPDAMLKFDSIDPAIAAFDKLNEQFDNNIGHVIPVEVGGLNSIVPILVAAQKGIPVIDADGAGRAVPSLTMTTFSVADVPSNPAILAKSADFGTSIFVSTAAEVEAFARPVLAVFGEEAGLAMWVMDKALLDQAVPIRDTLQLAENVGAILTSSAGKPAEETINAILQMLSASGLAADIVFSGIMQTPETKTQGGFDFSTVTLRNENNDEVWIYVQNENLLVWNPQTTTAMITAPDSICYLCVKEDGSVIPFSNADIEPLGIIGQKAYTIGITARSQLQTGTILNSFKKSLADFGFRVPYRPFPQ
ncbi:MAG TPA: DUF917 domain-containing protein [Oscillatoriales cyanobacterium M59_W2019_021]|nr:MAG: DUF917 domain-containing protein [Cyanobacteria bacterium J055]HIK31178.1 DUF917 domain-containing protein [Oscillatoriales cyanobacterium M4454_W2019_049]HIK51410.1 DUF917 domain-containing protein [Oscillatoriales cyanobacterium M59_W2019_021]